MIEKIIKGIESLKSGKGFGGTLATMYADGMLDKAIQIVQEVARDGGWIPCETELPPEPKENPVFDNKPLELYLVTLQGTEYPFRAFWTGKEFTDGWGKLSYVTAWQPLPPKYEPKLASYQKGE